MVEYFMHVPFEDLLNTLIKLHNMSPSQAKNAYSALTHIPCLSQIKFQPLLSPYKKLWNCSQEKYQAFWDAASVLQELGGLDLTSGAQHLNNATALQTAFLRVKCILLLRLLHLFRSDDLAQTLRSISFVGTTPYILVKRKGAKTYKWEALMDPPSLPHLSPWRAVQAYVEATSLQGRGDHYLFHCNPLIRH